MSAINIAKENVSMKTVLSVLAIFLIIAGVDAFAFFEGHHGFLYSSGISLVTTFVFAIFMTLYIIRLSVSQSSIAIEDYNNRFTIFFSIFHIVIALFIVFSNGYSKISSFWDAGGYLLLPFTFVIISLLTLVQRK